MQRILPLVVAKRLCDCILESDDTIRATTNDEHRIEPAFFFVVVHAVAESTAADGTTNGHARSYSKPAFSSLERRQCFTSRHCLTPYLMSCCRLEKALCQRKISLLDKELWTWAETAFLRILRHPCNSRQRCRMDHRTPRST